MDWTSCTVQVSAGFDSQKPSARASITNATRLIQLLNNMTETTYRGRRAACIENSQLRVTVLYEGGHIAELLVKETGVNPLWTPPWPTIEPSTYDVGRHPEYGSDAESKLLAGIHGHNLCLDLWGPPSAAEAAAGMTVHGEASVALYTISGGAGQVLVCQCLLPAAQLAFERKLELDGSKLLFSETVRNLGALDRPIAWTQHVTLGPPFLVGGETQFRVPATRSMTYEGEVFDWPMLRGEDLRVFTNAAVSGKFSTHLLDPADDQAYFVAWSPQSKTVIGYRWQREDFPWIGIWEENRSRAEAPWNGETITRGMEFGVSPMPESRRKMVDRGSLFGVEGYRWIPARSAVSVHYEAFARRAEVMLERPD